MNSLFCTICGDSKEKIFHDGRIIDQSKLTKDNAYGDGVMVDKIMTVHRGRMMCMRCYSNLVG